MSFESGSWLTATSIASLASYFAVEDVGEDLWQWTNNLQKPFESEGIIYIYRAAARMFLLCWLEGISNSSRVAP